MQNLEHASPPSSSLFQLWITQWQLGILDPKEAPLVLKKILAGLRTRKVDDPFWGFLAQFFASPAGSETSLTRNADGAEGLLERARSLQLQEAKSLLEYLGRCYAFDGDDLQFWKTVHAAIAIHVATRLDTPRRDS